MLHNPLSLGIQSHSASKQASFHQLFFQVFDRSNWKGIKQAPLSLLYRPPWPSGDYYNMNAMSIKYEVLFHKLTIHYTKSKESFSEGQCVSAFSFYLTAHNNCAFTVTLSLSVKDRWLHCCWAATSFSIITSCSAVILGGVLGDGGFWRTAIIRAWSSSCFLSFFSWICSSERTPNVEHRTDRNQWYHGYQPAYST